MFVHKSHSTALRLITSASDLTAASKCEFAFLRRVDVKLGRDVEVPPDDDPMLARAARLGDAHEDRVLREYRDELGAGVVEVDPPASMGDHDLREAAERTREALTSGAEVVCQAAFFEPTTSSATSSATSTASRTEIGFVGFADFLRRQPDGSFEVQDAKLARRARVTALMQLGAYAEQLERIGVLVAPEAALILGDGTRSMHRLSEIEPVLRKRRARMHALLISRVAATAPIEWEAPGIQCCGRCEVCEPEVQRTRDPLLIAGIRRSQRDTLVDAGVRTIDQVAALSAGEEAEIGLRTEALAKLSRQAALQIAGEASKVPPFRVIDPGALAALPAPNPGDLFFDFEGDPFYAEARGEGGERASRVTWGIDYLFGMVDASEQFMPWWAHDLAAERAVLERFLAFVADRRTRYPGMHIYHYAPYERTHLLSIAARHGVGEAEVDQLLREHVLVDLYSIVKNALMVGSRSYSIKKLEPLYMGDELRDDEGVTSGSESVVQYAEARALMKSARESDQTEGRERLDAIADYNRYDCVSTLRLRDWLRGLQRELGVPSAHTELAYDDVGDAPDVSDTARRLAEHALRTDDRRDREAAALAGAAIDYYQREHKAFWWAHFARLVDPVDDWADTRDVMIIDAAASVSEGWIPPEGQARAHRRVLRLRGDIAPGSTFQAGRDVMVLYDAPPPFATRGSAPGARGARTVKVLDVHAEGLTVEERGSRDEMPTWNELPVAVTPGAPPRVDALEDAIAEWGRDLAASYDTGTAYEDPAYAVLRRDAPRLEGAGGLAASASVDAVTESLVRLRRSALAVQGPPGTGKTYLAAQVIRALVEDHGWQVGVVAQSHAVVEHVLTGAVAAGLATSQVGKAKKRGRQAGSASPSGLTELPTNGHARFMQRHRDEGRGSVVGGTAWDFSNRIRFPRRSLDLLVIDEAGQFSLAPTIASSVAAERLLLLGDPQQLPQVTQGTHPEAVDASALGWLLGENDTMPEGLGYFLPETWRMRPELASVVSELSYEGRLRSHLSAADRHVRGAGPAGLVWHPVRHTGNSTQSPEEAEEVVRIAREMLAGTLHEPGQAPRTLTVHDLIVVAAYNAQVECIHTALAAAGLSEIRVGTVDRFQGQEAVIAIVSLAASSPEDVPRGLEFLLMRNRLNVALSRAQWAAHLVSSESLGDGLPSSPAALAGLSGYLRLLERATTARQEGDTLEE